MDTNKPTRKTRSKGFAVIRYYDENLLKLIIYMHGSIVGVIASEHILKYKKGVIGYNSNVNNRILNTWATDHII